MMYTRTTILATVIALLCGSSVYSTDDTLCADVGGTRIKAAILHSDASLEEIQDAKVVTFDSREWWDESFPKIFSDKEEDSLPDRLSSSYSKISFGISGPVVDHAYYLNSNTKIPKNLGQQCEEVANKPVYIENDATTWAKGALAWNRLIGQEITYPCLAVTLGTGVGCVLINSPSDFINIEIGFIECPFTRLHECSAEQPIPINEGKRSSHRPIGKAYFEWVKKEKPSWDDDKVTEVFNHRMIAFFTDMDEFLKNKLNIKVNSIMIGGGNSRFIDKHRLIDALKLHLLVLSPKSIEKYGVSPDIVSLLGCLDMSEERKITTMPPIEWIEEYFDKRRETHAQ